jgi:Trk K+ transport system NAD-binding subunit
MRGTDHVLSNHIIIAGLSHVGYRCLGLLAQLGQPAAVITREVDDWRLPAQSHCTVLHGDVHDEKVLRDAGIERARAIIVATDDDLTNVSISLNARRLNPRIVIVARLFDQTLATHLEESVHIDRVLSTSALAAPAFAAATLGDTARGLFESDGVICTVEERVAEATDSNAQTVGQYAARSGLAVVALRRNQEVTPRPAFDTHVLAGDRLTLLGVRPAEASSMAAEGKSNRHPSGISWVKAMATGVLEWWREVHVALRVAVILLLGITMLSVVVFQRGLGISAVDSLYFVVTTITTTGYGDYNLRDASVAMKLYGAFLMLCGAAVIATVFSVITDLMLSTRLRDVLARGCAKYRGHIIVVGLGNIGFRLVRELVRSGESVVAIEQRDDGEFVEAARALAPVVLGNGRTVETLRKAGMAGAKAMVAVTDDDLVNLGIGLATKQARPSCRVVLRVFDSQLADNMHESLGVDSMLSVSGAAAPTFVGAALCPDVRQGLVLQDVLLLLFSRKILSGSAQSGCQAIETGARESALFVKRAGMGSHAAVSGDCVLHEGDEVIGLRWYQFSDRQGSRG